MEETKTPAEEVVPVAVVAAATAAEDSESEDSDYDPTKDPTAEDDDAAVVVPVATGLGPALQGRRKRKADEAWDEMNAADEAFLRKVTSASVAAAGRPRRAAPRRKRRRALKVLGQIFGAQSAATLVDKAAGERRKRRKGAVDAGAVRDAARAAVRSLKQEKVQITQSVQFAGEMTTVTRTVEVHSKEAALAQQPEVPKSGLDTVLNEMKGPKTITTLEKTSVDWDGYKEEHKLADELEKKTKDGYLARQDFLNRCDVRSFEQEKADRNLQRSKQQAASGKK